MRIVVVLPAPFGPEEAEHLARPDVEQFAQGSPQLFAELARLGPLVGISGPGVDAPFVGKSFVPVVAATPLPQGVDRPHGRQPLEQRPPLIGPLRESSSADTNVR